MLKYCKTIIFWFFIVIWGLVCGIVSTFVVLSCNRKLIDQLPAICSKGVILILKHVIGLNYQIIGRENLPSNASYIIVSNHQSVWEALCFPGIFKKCVGIAKKESLFTPVYSWIYAINSILIDRAKGQIAIRKIFRGISKAIKAKKPIIIFPQGTRVSIGDYKRYKPGIVAIHEAFPKIPIVPIAINSGLFWPARKLFMKAGTITVKVLPAMKAGIATEDFLAKLEQVIEHNSSKLYANE